MFRTTCERRQWLWSNFLAFARVAALAVCLFLGTLSAGIADNEAPRWGYLEDTSATLDIAEVATRDFAPTKTYFAKGFTRSAHWVRLDAPRSGELMFLSVGLPILDDVRLFTQGRDGRWSQKRSGDTVPYASRPWQSPFLGFVLTPQELARPVFLRIASSGTNAVILNYQTLAEGLADEQRMMMVHAAMFGLQLMVIAVCLVMSVATGDRIFVWFSLVQVIWLSAAFLFNGYASVLYPLRTTDTAYSVMSIVSFLVEMVFHLLVIRRFAPARWLLGAAMALVAATAVSVLILWTQDISHALQVRSGGTLVFIILMVALAATARDAELMPLGVLRLIYCVYFALVTLWVVPMLGLTEAHSVARHAVVLHGTVNFALIFIIVLRIGMIRQKQAQRARDALSKAEIDRQVSVRLIETQGSLIRMLSHEVGTALSVIRYSIAKEPLSERNRKRVETAITGLDQSVKSLVDADRIASGTMALHISTVDPVELMKEIISDRSDHRVGLIIGAGVEGLFVESDPTLLRLVLRHLLDNACKYAADDSHVDVEVSSGNDTTLTFAVRNALRPGPRPDLAKLKERYYRDPHVMSLPGTGVGLTVVEEIAGHLQAQFQLSFEGTIFAAKLEVKQCWT